MKKWLWQWITFWTLVGGLPVSVCATTYAVTVPVNVHNLEPSVQGVQVRCFLADSSLVSLSGNDAFAESGAHATWTEGADAVQFSGDIPVTFHYQQSAVPEAIRCSLFLCQDGTNCQAPVLNDRSDVADFPQWRHVDAAQAHALAVSASLVP